MEILCSTLFKGDNSLNHIVCIISEISRRGDMEILGFCLLQWLCRALFLGETTHSTILFVLFQSRLGEVLWRSYVVLTLGETTQATIVCIISEPSRRGDMDILG
jgi:hypothetical protein